MTRNEPHESAKSEIDNLVGADVVEVSPPFDHAEITSLAAVDAMFECMCLIC